LRPGVSGCSATVSDARRVSRLRRIRRDGAMSNEARLGRRAREGEFREAATRAQCADKASKGASGGPFASLSPKRKGPPLLLGEITLGPIAAHRMPWTRGSSMAVLRTNAANGCGSWRAVMLCAACGRRCGRCETTITSRHTRRTHAKHVDVGQSPTRR
jgi:hypothetical protein